MPRFSLLHLLLVFPAYFVGVMLCAAIEGRGNYRYMRAQNDIEALSLSLEIAQDSDSTPPSDSLPKLFDQWAISAPIKDDPVEKVFRECRRKDPWGAPYRCVARTSPPYFGIYSTGRDRVSRSFGNDPDDLNSWDKQSGAFYRNEIASAKRREDGVGGLYVAPFVYVLMLLGWSAMQAIGKRTPVASSDGLTY